MNHWARRWIIDFEWAADQQVLAEQTQKFASAHLNENWRERERNRQFGREEWRLCGEYGLLGLSVPERWGGLGLDSLSTALAVEAFGAGCEDMGLVFSACAHLFAVVMPIVEHADDPTAQRYLPGLASGKLIGANAISEPEAGSDVSALRTSARREGEHYVLSGIKSYVTNAPVADVFLVYASTNPADGFQGLSAFLIERGTPGLEVGPQFDKLGLTTSPTASVYLQDVVVPATSRLGPEGAGRDIFLRSMDWERTCLLAAYLGSMTRQLDQCVQHVTTRRQYRRPLGKKQAVAHRIADMKLRLESSRLLLHRACWRLDQGSVTPLDISMAKLAISEAAVQSGLDAVHLHGASGVMGELGIEQALRDAVPATVFSGVSEVHRDVIARSLGL